MNTHKSEARSQKSEYSLFANTLRHSSLLVIFLLVLLPHTVSAQTNQPTLDEYITLLREASAAAQRGDRLGLEDVANRLAATTTVRLADGSTAPVDNRWLAEALNPTDPDFTAIEARLGAVINALSLPAGSAPTDALQQLNDILNNPPFAERVNDTSWIDGFLNWLGRVLDSFLRPISPAVGRGGEVTAWVLGIVGVILLLAVVAYLLLGLRRNLVANAKRAGDDPETNLTAKTALEQASDLARGGDHRTAMRYLYLSALLWLDERDLLRYDRALTNREYLDRVRENPALRGKLAPIVETFDRVWYGHVPLDDADFAAYKAQVEALRAEVRS